jgi:hypothetical protein
MPTPFSVRKAVSGTPLREAWPGSPESLARGMLTKGFPVNPGELPTSLDYGLGYAQPKGTRSPGNEVAPREAKQALDEEKPVAKGDRRRQLWVDEQSYDSILPMKVENRRAPARGGHGIHWREGMNRSMYRRSATCTGR